MVTKLFLFVLVFAILNILFNIIDFITYRMVNKEAGLFHYISGLSNRRLIPLGLAIAYIFVIIITGFAI